jgi:hypothetical protein
MTAISGTRRQYKEMADGTLRVSIDIDPSFKTQFLEMFGSIDMPVALAPLHPDFEQPKEEEKPKGGPLAESAGRLCETQTFRDFLKERYFYSWLANEFLTPSGSAAEVVREICKVESRAEIDHKEVAAKRFHELMREFREWTERKFAR